MNTRAHAVWLLPVGFGLLSAMARDRDRSANAQPRKSAEYALVWSDEFSGADGTKPDAAKWTYDLGHGGNGWGNQELESYTDRRENSQMRQGNLVVTVRREKFAGPDGVTLEYTSARLKTQKLFSQTYGRIEARIKIPKGEGMWPAFWMLGEDIDEVSWPRCGEIDIMENIGKEPGVIHGSLHGPSSLAPKAPGGKSTSNLTKTTKLPAGQSYSGAFHLYAVEWEPDAIRFYVDAKLYASFGKADWPRGGTWVFDHPFFIILNLAVGGDWPGPPDANTKFPQEMLVDYVRVYSKN